MKFGVFVKRITCAKLFRGFLCFLSRLFLVLFFVFLKGTLHLLVYSEVRVAVSSSSVDSTDAVERV